jgi:glycosyltransferase involved in cell wall biosynthesis
MKILQVITELYPAGAERVVCDLSLELQRRGHEVEVVSLQPLPPRDGRRDCIVEALEQLQIPVHSLAMTKLTPWRIFRLREHLARFTPDVVHSHLFHANLATRLMRGAWRNARFVNSVHNSDKRTGKKWQFFIEKMTISRCDYITAVSTAAAGFFAKKVGMSKDQIGVVHNGIRSIESLNNAEICELRKQWGVENCSRVIGSVGYLSYQKGYDRLLNVICELRKRIPAGEHWGVVILGEGEQRALLERESECLQDDMTVRFPGFRTDAARCIGAFDMFVMPSRFEGFGLTLAEAMAHGLPILASNVDSLPELMQQYENGECVDFNDLPTTAERIQHWVQVDLRTPQLRWTVEKMVDGYEELYRPHFLSLHHEGLEEQGA